MRLAELSRRSGVARSTIKFYLREGLLPVGDPLARNQASYGPRHLERLALITALREVADLPLEVIGRVTADLDRGWEPGADPIGHALRAIHAPPAAAPEEAEERERLEAEVRALLRGLPWTTGDEGHFFADELAATLLRVRRHLYPDYPVAALEPLAQIAWLLSEVEFANAPGGARVPLRARGDDVEEPTRRAILGSLLFERVFSALRRCAHAMRAIRLSEGREVPAAADPGTAVRDAPKRA